MYKIKCNYQTIISKENKFIAKVKEKEPFIVETINAYGGKFENIDHLMNLIQNKNSKTHHHPLTGPIYIENAKPGDVIKVQIEKMITEEMAQSLSKTAGIEPIQNTSIEDRMPIIGKKQLNHINYYHKVKLPYQPMIGMIATTPKEEIIKTGHAKQKNGGNLDLPFVGENTNIYLPVEIEGAGLYLGDVHALQAYGELSGIAMEASSKIKLKIEILKPKKEFNHIVIIGKEPFSKKQCLGIVGIGEKMNIEEAIHDAFIGTCNLIEQLLPKMPKNSIKCLITLIGNSFNGQAFSKTSESTNSIVIKKKDIERITKHIYRNFSKKIEQILFKKV